MLRLTLGTSSPTKQIILQSITVTPTKSATIKYTLISDNFPTDNEYIMDGEQYARWGTDDTIIYHILCMRHGLTYQPYVEPEFFEEAIVWRNEETGEIRSEIIRKPNPKYVPT
jgi:hypothetical protein